MFILYYVCFVPYTFTNTYINIYIHHMEFMIACQISPTTVPLTM